LTTFVSPRPDQHVTSEANEADVASIRKVVRSAGSEGLPLNSLFDRLGAASGYPLSRLSTTVMQLLRERQIVLTPERRLLWIGPDQ
jgi:hypothetical protein